MQRMAVTQLLKSVKVGVLGLGEVGSAIAQFYENPSVQDLKTEQKFADDETFDVLHVCIPWGQNFIQTVHDVIQKHAPAGLTIIHSTVPVGTTEYIGNQIGARGKFIVHSPVRGIHPELHKGIKTFIKYIGADFSGAGRLVAEHYDLLGIKYEVCYKSRTTELMKLLDTTYYGVCIAFHQYAADICDKEALSFDVVMGHANNSYNAGYSQLGLHQFVRPILYPPDGKIGGHCVIPNAKILLEQYGDDYLLKSVLRYE